MNYAETPLLSQGYAAPTQPHPKRAITSISFDPVESLLWTGNQQGTLESWLISTVPGPVELSGEESASVTPASTTLPPLTRYTKFPVHPATPITRLWVGDVGIYSQSTKGIVCNHRRGLTLFRKSLSDIGCFWVAPTGSGLYSLFVSVGMILHQFNAHSGTPIRTLSLDFSPTLVRVSELGVICLADDTGHIHQMERSLGLVNHHHHRSTHAIPARASKTIKAHHNSVIDFGCDASTVAVIGAASSIKSSGKHNTHQPSDPLVRLFDLRAGASRTVMMPISFNRARACAFHPQLPGILCLISVTGLVMLIDVNDPSQLVFVPVPVVKDVSCMAFSSSGNFIAFGDTLGYVYGLSNSTNPCVNAYSRPSEYLSWAHPSHRPNNVPDHPHLDWNDPLSMVGMPYYSHNLLSSQFPKELHHTPGMEGLKIDANLIQQAKMIDFIGYLSNPKLYPRNAGLHFSRLKVSTGPKFRSEQNAPHLLDRRAGSSSITSGDGGLSGTHTSQQRAVIEDPYAKLEIKYSRFGIEDFDFAYYNHTRYSGLETHIQNSYINAFIQVLNYVKPMAAYAAEHIQCECKIEFCMLCEFGFLVRMLENGNGLNCQALNFLRSFRMQPNAKSLGLLEHEMGVVSYASLMQLFNRFILEQFHKEAAGSFVQDLFASKMQATSKCLVCGNVKINHIEPFVLDLHRISKTALLSGGVKSRETLSFAAELSTSFARENTAKAWCVTCNNYQSSFHKRKTLSLPPILQINVHPDMLEEQNHMRHHHGRNATKGVAFKDKTWIPFQLNLGLDSEGLLTEVGEYQYELTAVISEVRRAKQKSHHLVSHILIYGSDEVKVGEENPSSQRGTPSPDPNDTSCTSNKSPSWYLFNDFLVQLIPKDQVTEISQNIRPVILQYSRRIQPDGLISAIDPRKALHTNVIETDQQQLSSSLSPKLPLWKPAKISNPYHLFRPNLFLNKRKDVKLNFVPLAASEIPFRPKTILAIDAEFVSMSKEEVEVGSDGQRSVVRPQRLGLARISVLRETGVPLIDDYIVTSEPVVDYLTEFSGINPGDLDLVSSQKPLVSLKHAYKKLRFLIDCGCVFVGHGLKSDFRIMNVLVPPGNVMDTVDLYFIPSRQRKLSLKFLYWAVVGAGIQGDIKGHDSIEDAFAALELYKVYVKRKTEGTFDGLLEDVYAIGGRCNFRVPEAAMKPPPSQHY